MPYDKFTLEKAIDQLQLSTTPWNAPMQGIIPRKPSQLLQDFLKANMNLALLIGTEKARSELIIMPILADVKHQMQDKVSIFSGKQYANQFAE